MNNTLNFDGKKNYVEVPLKCPANDGGAITVEFWNYSDTQTQSIAFSFADGEGLKSERVSCHAPWSDGQIYWDCGDSVNGRLNASYSDYLKKWVHIALVSGGASDPGYQAIYINGKCVTEQKTSKKSNRSFNTLLIGAAEQPDNGSKTYFHSGKIDQFRVWDRVLTPKEINRNMNAELIGDEPGLVACFNFNWGIADKIVGELWKKLPNSVPGATDGDLRGFAGTEYTESDVSTKAPVGPIFRLTKGGAEYYTASYAEKKKMIELKWVEDAAPAFYAHRAPAPGTIPLCRFRNTKEEAYRLTASRVDRETLDPRKNKNQAVGEWCYDGEIGYVSATQNGKAAPYPSDTTQPTLCYVLPSIDSNYEPKPIEFAGNGLSENLWYAIVCRSLDEKQGLMLEGKDAKPKLAVLPESGDYRNFQWRIQGDQLINRAYSDATLKVSNNKGWAPVANKGTDCFSLLQGDKPLLEKAEWTLLATELHEGYTIPYPPATHCGLPFSKYLSATDGKATVHVLGTGTVSDWAMLRSKLIIENMMRALKPEVVDTKPLDGVEVIVISKDDSSEELANAPCLGCIAPAKKIEQTRGFAVDFMCFVTEEAMWTDRVFSGTPEKIHHRQFDQLIHEFGHVLHRATTIEENQTPIGVTPEGPDKTAAEAAKNSQRKQNKSELYAMSVQSWFNNITTVGGQYYPETREKLKRVDLDRYTFIATHFNAANTWMPPIEFRKEPSHTVDDDKSGDTAPDDYESGDTAPEGISV